MQKDISDGNTIIGGMLTSTIRSLDETTEDNFHKSATTAGLDFTQYFREMNYIFQLRTAFSNVTGNRRCHCTHADVHQYITFGDLMPTMPSMIRHALH
ncbi:MAG: hypothetical protein MZV63_50200 [Marinilabiliales bacterium]|nr:hypothetical protein [Marinilabiliales bacterium]